MVACIPTPPWLAIGRLYGLSYLGWLCLAVLAVAGVGIALGHKPSMRLALIVLVVLIGVTVVLLPNGIGLACGWIRIDFSRTDLAATFHVSSESLKRLEQHVGFDIWRIAHILALLEMIGGIILKIAAFVWLRWELARDVASGNGAQLAQQP